jgi:parallel beta-helix repeat protein
MSTPRARAVIAAVATALLAVGTLGATAAAAPHLAPNVVVVDDDGAQCPQADTSSVQAALNLVRDGGRVRVCPGRYAERLTVRHSVTVQGEVGAVASLDCLAPAPKESDALEPTRFAILEPGPGDATDTTPLLRIEADDVEVSGLVVQGLTDDAPERPTPTVSLYDAAIVVTDAASRVRLHHNLIRENTLGVELGGPQSRVDHNCLRDNDFAIANQRYHLVSGRIDDNTTFRTTILPFEIGWTYAGTTDVQIDHNLSVEDLPARVIWVENALRPRIEANEVRAARSGVVLRLSSGAVVAGNEIRAGVAGFAVTRNTDGRVTDNRVITSGQGVALGGGNADVVVARNHVTGTASGGAFGIVLLPPAPAPVNDGITIEDNTVSGLHASPGSGVVVRTGSVLPGSVVRRNLVSGNPGDGIVLGPDIDGLLVSSNVANQNGVDGIRLEAGASDNVLEDNTALGNGSVDARDLSSGAGATTMLNQWLTTTCVTDVPTGAICVRP